MHTTRVRPASLGRRLDPEHYDPDAVAVEMLLQLSPRRTKISEVVNPERRITNGVRGPEVAESPYRLVRLQDCINWEVDLSACLRISHDQYADNRRCRLAPDDVVVAIGGYLGNAAVVRTSEPAVIGQHSALLPFGHATAHDPRYLVAFLNSRIGAIQFRRWARGTVQAGLNLEDIGDIEVLCPTPDAQRYIGSKVRLAETLREWARELTASAFELVDGLFPGQHQAPLSSAQHARIASGQLVDRLNAEAYAPQHLRDATTMRASGLSLRPLGELVSAPINNSIRNVTEALGAADGQVPMFRPADIAGLWANADTAPRLPRGFEAQHEKSRVLPGDLVLGIAGTIGVAGRVPPTVTFGNINGSSARVRPKPELRGYLAVFLNSPLGSRSFTRWSVGAVQKHLNLEDLPGILVPVPDAVTLDTLNRWVATAERATLAARSLVAGARLLVEALIERKVTEAELVAAGKDLDADRALLARLRTDGLDGAGEPLFHDLDGLATLLAEATSGRAS